MFLLDGMWLDPTIFIISYTSLLRLMHMSLVKNHEYESLIGPIGYQCPRFARSSAASFRLFHSNGKCVPAFAIRTAFLHKSHIRLLW